MSKISRFEFIFDNTYHDKNANPQYEMRSFTLNVDGEKFKQMDQNEEFLDACRNIELVYGVHDLGGVDTDQCYTMEISSYEIKPGKRDSVMQDWQRYFTEQHKFVCSPVEIKQYNIDDYSIDMGL